MTTSPDVNFEELARSTDEFNGAQLKAVCVEAGMIALREGATRLGHEHFLSGIAEGAQFHITIHRSISRCVNQSKVRRRMTWSTSRSLGQMFIFFAECTPSLRFVASCPQRYMCNPKLSYMYSTSHFLASWTRTFRRSFSHVANSFPLPGFYSSCSPPHEHPNLFLRKVI